MSAPAVKQLDEDAELRRRYLPLVRRIAMKTVRKLPPSINVQDLIGIGWVGLLEALKRQDGSMSAEQLEAFCAYRVRGAILDHLRKLDPMCRRLRNASRRISKAIETLHHRLGREPHSEEISGELGIPEDEYLDLLSEIDQAGMVTLDVASLPASSDQGASPEDLVKIKNLTETVAEAITRLPDRLRSVMVLHYTEGCTLKEIGEVLGVSESRASQMRTEAIHRIRSWIHRGGNGGVDE